MLSLPGGFVMASKRVAVDRHPICFMYREPVDRETDSGWRLLSGEEDQAYADDPANIGVSDPRTIVAIDPTIAPLLSTPAPCGFERDSADEPFRPSDFDFAAEVDG